MDKLHIAQPKKRDNRAREAHVPDTVLQGIKKSGPTIKELQEEYGGAGPFYIPEEEHYILENEDWRYDKWPEFYQGKNVADFYDPEIEAKLNALEEEEAKILEMEADNEDMSDGSDSDEDGVTMDDLRKAVTAVRGKVNIIKQRSLLKAKRRARSKIRNLDDMTKDLQSKGIEVNTDSLATRVRNVRRIGDLEAAQDKKAKDMLGDDSDDDDRELVDDEELAAEEAEQRGRKGRDIAEKKKKLLGKRARNDDSDVDMESDGSSESDGKGTVPKAVRGSLSKQNRSLTPAQRKISVQKIIRDRSASRREGSEPQRLAYKVVPEEQIRLAKKINASFKHKIAKTEADRTVTVKRPKHLYAGKMSNGKKDYR